MIKVTTKHAGWGVTLGAVILAAAAFPSISETASEHRHDTKWQERAENLGAPAAEVKSVLAERLAVLQTSAEFASEFERDFVVTENLLTYRAQDFDTVAFNQAEQRCMAEAIYYEARSETRAGQKAVGEVIMNRVASKHFPDTICGVVYEGSERTTGCQFTFTCDGSMEIAPRGRYWEESQAMSKLVMMGGFKPLTNRATHYHTTAVDPHWSNTMRMTRRVGSHVFYRFAPRNYVPSTPTIAVAPPS